MSDKYVLVTNTSEPIYWTDFLEGADTPGISRQVYYTCLLWEAKRYDTEEAAIAGIVETKKGLHYTYTFRPMLVTEKELFISRLKE